MRTPIPAKSKGNRWSIPNLERDFYQLYSLILKGKPQFNIIYDTIEGLSKYPTLFEDMYEGRIDGIIVKNFISQDELDHFYKSLREQKQDIVDTREKKFGFFLGKSLYNSDPDLKEYLDKAELFEKELLTLFNFDYCARFQKVLEYLAEGKKVCRPTHSSGRNYLGATIRFMEPHKGALVEHCGLQFYDIFAETAEIESTIDKSNQISAFCCLQQAEKGGALQLFDITYQQTHLLKDQSLDGLKNFHNLMKVVRKRGYTNVKPNEGDLLLFNGGWIWHRIQNIKGNIPRITIGSFTAFSKDRSEVYYWS